VRSNELIDKLIQYGYEEQVHHWKAMAAFTLQIDKLEHTRYTEQDMDLLHFAIQNMMEELVPAAQRLSPVIIEQTIVTIVGHTDPDQEAFNKFLFSITENVQQQVHKFLDLQVSIGISLPFTDWSNIPRAYREGLDALRLRIKLGEGIIIQYEDVSAGKHYLNLNYPQHIELELIDAIKLADEEQATELLKQFLSAVLAAELTPQEYQVSLARLLNSLLIVLQEAGISLNQIQYTNSSLFEQLTRLHTASDIEQWFRASIMEPMINIFRDRQDAQYHNISEKMIDMIQKFYDTDLTLEQCAAELHYNANYLSSVFRKETNYSFSEYLAAYRFNMAKRWLSETDMTIKDIATKLRYNNPQNFIRSFRKHEGMTPGQYREKHMKHMVINRPH
jgi:AraC-like DNA-binding protein